MIDVRSFVERWKGSGASERANYQLFLSELCDVLEVSRPNPASDNTAQNAYSFERGVSLSDTPDRSSVGFIDLYKRDCFILEAKQGSDKPDDEETDALGLEAPTRKVGTARRGTRTWERAMERAKNQALRYARALPKEDGWPPFLIVSDVGYCFDLYADFSRQGKNYVPFPDSQRYRILLEELERDNVRQRLRAVWSEPMALDPAARSARVTRDLAEKLAYLASSLEADGHEPGRVSQFLMRCLFTMFAEDVELLPKGAFTRTLQDYEDALEVLPQALQALWSTMDTGGFVIALKKEVTRFNGSLFADAEALPLTRPQLELLTKAAEADWRDVEPAIFGTLLERALEPRERHKLGAHYTPRAYVERLVVPTVIEPLREEWNAARTAAAALEAEGDEQGARREIEDFHRHLCSVRVLDPACGTGNFLYVTLEHLKRLEGEVLKVLEGYGGQQVLDMTGGLTVSPQQFLGLEVNPRAVAIADIVLWIGYLQWHFRTFGNARRLDPPILRRYNNILEQDAVLAYDGRIPRVNESGEVATRWDGHTTKSHPVTGVEVPDETARVPIYDYVDPRPTVWPDADYIVGNPPFIGTARMREALGDGYTEALRRTYRGEVPDSADYVLYWWHKAAELVRTGKAQRFGFIATNSLRQTFNRRVLQAHLDATPLFSLTFAIPDHPWVESSDGAAVRISMTVGASGTRAGRLATVVYEESGDDLGRSVTLEEQQGKIGADLTIGADVASTTPLRANSNLTSRGVQLYNNGFIVTTQEAERLGLGKVPGLEQHIRPYRHGRDLTSRPRDVMVIDLFGLSSEQVRDRFPEVYQWLLERVKPERDQSREPRVKERWWLHGRTRDEMKSALLGLQRYIATVETSKHRFFQFLDASILPDNMLVAIASDDAYHLGVLSSRTHVVYALAAGGRLGYGNDPRYNKTRCFEPFPFPAASDEQKERIRTIAESLDAHRKQRLDLHDRLTMTEMYNVLEKLKVGEKLSTSEQRINEQGLVSILLELHRELDTAVADAYGWPVNLTDDELLSRLVALNTERAAEEARGLIRYLRPSFQNPQGTSQIVLAVETGREAQQPLLEKPRFPRALREQVQAVKWALAQMSRPATSEEVAQSFTRAPRKQVDSLLETLEALGLVQTIGEDTYAV